MRYTFLAFKWLTIKSAAAGPYASSRATTRFTFFRPLSVTALAVLTGATKPRWAGASTLLTGMVTPEFMGPTKAKIWRSAMILRALEVPEAGSA